MRRKLIAWALTLSMVLSMLPTMVMAADYPDMPNDYSTEALEAAVENGLLSGSDGNILPDDNLTRAQLAAILVRAFGAEVAGDLSGFSDVDASGWYYDELSMAVNMGIIQGSGTEINPDSAITRQEAFVVLARAFALTETGSASLSDFADGNQVASWAEDAVLAMIEAGYVQGDGTNINPLSNILRKDFAVIMNRMVTTYISDAGTITDLADGSVMIQVADVTLQDVAVAGNLIIGDGVGEGDVTLDGVTVSDTTLIRGGGENSIYAKNGSDLGNVVIQNVNHPVSLKMSDSATADSITVNSEDVTLTGVPDGVDIIAEESVSVNGTTVIAGDSYEVGASTTTSSSSGGTTTTTTTTATTEIAFGAVPYTTTAGAYLDMSSFVTRNTGANDTITWSVDDDAIATVDSGKLGAMKAGIVTVTATANGYRATATVTISEPSDATYTIYVPGTILNDCTFTTLTIDESVGTGDYTLNNCIVDNLITNGGGANSGHLSGGAYTVISMEYAPEGGSRLALSNDVIIGTVNTYANAILEVEGAAAITGAVTASEDLTLKNVTVENLTTTGSASTLTLGSSASVTTLTATAPTNVVANDATTKIEAISASADIQTDANTAVGTIDVSNDSANITTAGSVDAITGSASSVTVTNADNVSISAEAETVTIAGNTTAVVSGTVSKVEVEANEGESKETAVNITGAVATVATTGTGSVSSLTIDSTSATEVELGANVATLTSSSSATNITSTGTATVDTVVATGGTVTVASTVTASTVLATSGATVQDEEGESVDSTEITTTTLNSIAITTLPTKTTYYTSDTLDTTGMVVTAYYTVTDYAGTISKAVTPDSVTGFETTAGTQTIEVSYTEGDITDTDTFEITVIDADQEAADAFTTTYAAILSKDEDTVAISDKTMVELALTAYEDLDAGVQAKLESEKARLDSLSTQITVLEEAAATLATAKAEAITALYAYWGNDGETANSYDDAGLVEIAEIRSDYESIINAYTDISDVTGKEASWKEAIDAVKTIAEKVVTYTITVENPTTGGYASATTSSGDSVDGDSDPISVVAGNLVTVTTWTDDADYELDTVTVTPDVGTAFTISTGNSFIIEANVTITTTWKQVETGGSTDDPTGDSDAYTLDFAYPTDMSLSSIKTDDGSWLELNGEPTEITVPDGTTGLTVYICNDKDNSSTAAGTDGGQSMLYRVTLAEVINQTITIGAEDWSAYWTVSVQYNNSFEVVDKTEMRNGLVDLASTIDNFGDWYLYGEGTPIAFDDYELPSDTDWISMEALIYSSGDLSANEKLLEEVAYGLQEGRVEIADLWTAGNSDVTSILLDAVKKSGFALPSGVTMELTSLTNRSGESNPLIVFENDEVTVQEDGSLDASAYYEIVVTFSTGTETYQKVTYIYFQDSTARTVTVYNQMISGEVSYSCTAVYDNGSEAFVYYGTNTGTLSLSQYVDSVIFTYYAEAGSTDCATYTYKADIVNDTITLPDATAWTQCWLVQLRYDSDEDGYEEWNSTLITSKEEITLPTPTKTDYTFKGWSMDGVLIDWDSYVLPANEYYVSLTTTWEFGDLTADGVYLSNVADNLQDVSIDMAKLSKGDDITAQVLTAAVKEGYTIPNDVDLSITYMDMDYYAVDMLSYADGAIVVSNPIQWEEQNFRTEITLTYNDVSYTTYINCTLTLAQTSYDLEIPSDITIGDYYCTTSDGTEVQCYLEYDGSLILPDTGEVLWLIPSYDSTQGYRVDLTILDGNTIAITEDDLISFWAITFSDTDGGNTSVSLHVASTEELVQYEPTFTRAGYVFDGWYYRRTSLVQTLYTDLNRMELPTTSYGATFNAKWTADTVSEDQRLVDNTIASIRTAEPLNVTEFWGQGDVTSIILDAINYPGLDGVDLDITSVGLYSGTTATPCLFLEDGKIYSKGNMDILAKNYTIAFTVSCNDVTATDSPYVSVEVDGTDIVITDSTSAYTTDRYWAIMPNGYIGYGSATAGAATISTEAEAVWLVDLVGNTNGGYTMGYYVDGDTLASLEAEETVAIPNYTQMWEVRYFETADATEYTTAIVTSTAELWDLAPALTNADDDTLTAWVDDLGNVITESADLNHYAYILSVTPQWTSYEDLPANEVSNLQLVQEEDNHWYLTWEVAKADDDLTGFVISNDKDDSCFGLTEIDANTRKVDLLDLVERGADYSIYDFAVTVTPTLATDGTGAGATLDQKLYLQGNDDAALRVTMVQEEDGNITVSDLAYNAGYFFYPSGDSVTASKAVYAVSDAEGTLTLSSTDITLNMSGNTSDIWFRSFTVDTTSSPYYMRIGSGTNPASIGYANADDPDNTDDPVDPDAYTLTGADVSKIDSVYLIDDTGEMDWAYYMSGSDYVSVPDTTQKILFLQDKDGGYLGYEVAYSTIEDKTIDFTDVTNADWKNVWMVELLHCLPTTDVPEDIEFSETYVYDTGELEAFLKSLTFEGYICDGYYECDSLVAIGTADDVLSANLLSAGAGWVELDVKWVTEDGDSDQQAVDAELFNYRSYVEVNVSELNANTSVHDAIVAGMFKDDADVDGGVTVTYSNLVGTSTGALSLTENVFGYTENSDWYFYVGTVTVTLSKGDAKVSCSVSLFIEN